jgi:DNA-binding SARP family transcriptional activator
MAPDRSRIRGDAGRARGAHIADKHGVKRDEERTVAIRLCGELRVTVDGQPISGTLTPQVGVALACLALNRPQPVTRERLLTAIWGDDAAADYANLLDSVLHKLRRATGPGVIERAEVRGWRLCRHVQVDFEDAERGLEAAATAAQQRNWLAVVEHAERVVGLASCGLLPAFEVDWLGDCRRRLEEWGVQAHQLLAEACLELGERHLPAAERAARAIVEADPYRETGYALLMRAVAAQGNPVEAQRIYNRLQARLKRSGHVPGPGLRAEFDRLMRGATAPPTGPAAAARPPRRPDPEERSFFTTRQTGPFVGRHDELEFLRDLFRRATAQRRREVILLSGDPGIGKTRLAVQLMSACESDGALALYGRCDVENEEPYQPFVEALCGYLPRAPAPRRDWWLERYGDDIMVVSRLAKALGISAGAGATAESAERYCLFEAVSEMLSDIARSQPVVLVLDDIHWAAKATRLMLREVVRSTARAPMLIVVVYRHTEGVAGLIDTRTHLRRELVFEHISLDGLGRDDTLTLIERLSSRPTSEAVRRRIWQDTEGNPFFVEELLHDLETRVRAAADEAVEVWRRRTVPPELDEVIGHRLAALSEETNRVLRRAAVIGRVFSLELLEAIGGVSEDEVDQAVEEALDAHVIAEIPQAYARYSFTHALIRQTLYERMTATRRARLHGLVGEALERMPTAADDRPLAELAHHFEALERAGRHDPERRFALLLGLGGAQARAGEVAAARRAFRDAAAVASQSGSARDLARAALGYGTAGQMAGGVVDRSVVTLLEDALARLGDTDPPLRARLLARLAMELSFTEQRARRAAISDEALRIARSIEDPSALGYALVARHWSLWGPANVEERLAASDELLVLAARTGDERLRMQGHRWRMIDLLELGRIDDADREMSAWILLAEKRRRPSEQPYAELFRAMRLLLAGELDEVETLSTHSRRLGERVQDTNVLQAHVVQMVTLRRERGGVDAAIEELVREQAERFASIPAWHCELALVHAELGRTEDARATLDRFGVREFRDLPLDGLWLGAITTLAETAFIIRDATHADLLHTLLEPYAERNVALGWVSACGGSVARYLGVLDRLRGRPDEAVAHLEAALEMNASMRARAWAARTRFDLADALLDAPDPRAVAVTRADRELDAALAEATALGMSRLVEDVSDRRRALERLQDTGNRV